MIHYLPAVIPVMIVMALIQPSAERRAALCYGLAPLAGIVGIHQLAGAAEDHLFFAPLIFVSTFLFVFAFVVEEVYRLILAKHMSNFNNFLLAGSLIIIIETSGKSMSYILSDGQNLDKVIAGIFSGAALHAMNVILIWLSRRIAKNTGKLVVAMCILIHFLNNWFGADLWDYSRFLFVLWGVMMAFTAAILLRRELRRA